MLSTFVRPLRVVGRQRDAGRDSVIVAAADVLSTWVDDKSHRPINPQRAAVRTLSTAAADSSSQHQQLKTSYDAIVIGAGL